jgi:hypothetical protein
MLVSISNSLPSRKYRKGREQAGLAHFDNMLASGLHLCFELIAGTGEGQKLTLSRPAVKLLI